MAKKKSTKEKAALKGLAAAVAAAAKKTTDKARQSGSTKSSSRAAAVVRSGGAGVKKGVATAAKTVGSTTAKTVAVKGSTTKKTVKRPTITLKRQPRATVARATAATARAVKFPVTREHRHDAYASMLRLSDKTVAAAKRSVNDVAAAINSSYLPVSGFRISSPFGVDRGTHRHSGIDLAVPVGTQVGAAKKGKVTFAGWGNGYGYRVIVDHGDGIETTYNHLSDIGVNVGDEVKAGAPIALSGNTGHSTGPHLHFEVRVNGKYVDPADYFDFGNGAAAKSDGSYTSKMTNKKPATSSTSGTSTGKSGSKTKKKVRKKANGDADAAIALIAKAVSSTGAKKKGNLVLPTATTPPRYREVAIPAPITYAPPVLPRKNYFTDDLEPLLRQIRRSGRR